MKNVVRALLVFSLSVVGVSVCAQTSQPTIPVSQIHAGMRGYALTVFQGIKPESMDVEVLGVLHNTNGPKGDIILVRLHGTKPEYTGVVAGMSGSPVYFDGKLAGALAFRIGEFSKEPIAGVTPIADMLEINALDKSPSEEAAAAKPAMSSAAGKTASPGDGAVMLGSTQDYSNYLKPIDTPLVFNGFSEDAVRRSVDKLEVSDAPVTASFRVGYRQWSDDHGGVFTITVAKAIEYAGETLRAGKRN